MAKNWKPIISKKLPDKKALATSKRPAVIVTGSGNGDAGKSADWLPLLLPKDNTVVAITGYAGASTVCGKLLSIKDLSIPNRRMSNNTIEWPNSKENTGIKVAEIRAQIKEMKGYSAHADQGDLLDWALRSEKEGHQQVGHTIFLQHGDDKNRETLREALLSTSAELGMKLDVQMPNDESGWISLEPEDNEPVDEDLEKIMAILKHRPELKAHIKI